jgi:hypothetical protein
MASRMVNVPGRVATRSQERFCSSTGGGVHVDDAHLLFESERKTSHVDCPQAR